MRCAGRRVAVARVCSEREGERAREGEREGKMRGVPAFSKSGEKCGMSWLVRRYLKRWDERSKRSGENSTGGTSVSNFVKATASYGRH